MPTPTRRTVTTLPDAHPFAEPTDGRRCAECGRRRKHGVHRNVPAVRSGALPHARRGLYRTSGTPRLAESGFWRSAALYARGTAG